jgi:two-component system NtrC family response regulator
MQKNPWKKMQKSRILIIDDEPVVCDGCRLALSEEPFAVDLCLSGREGLDALLRQEYDLILLDMKLPDVDGMEILRVARKDRPRVYLIVMTGYSTVKNAVEAMKAGAFDYLAKPFSDDELLLAVERALEHKRLKEENETLREQLFQQFNFSSIIGQNPRILELFDEIRRVAPTESTVLICGESGTGKELFARAIHSHSARAGRHFIAVDCSSLSPHLLESELFGHVRGAFTGAVRDKDGIFEAASQGTLFLDEISNITLEVQGKLLRVMDSREYKPVGASRVKETDVRIIAATNQDLQTMVAEGRFREDLFYRLNVFPIQLPPLRERRDDIPSLTYHFLRLYSRQTGKPLEGFTDDALQILVHQDWPGNVRQLKNVIERLVIMADQKILDHAFVTRHLHNDSRNHFRRIPETAEELQSIKKEIITEEFGSLEKAFLVKALQACEGNVTRAARHVGMQRSNFHTLMKKHAVSAAEFKPSN